MAPSRKFTARLGIYGVVLLYLLCDLHFCAGPLSRKLRSADPKSAAAAARAKEQGIVAVVYGVPLTLRQLDRAVAERMLLDGHQPADLPPQTLRLLRHAALDDLIDHEILRMKVKVSVTEFKVTPAEVDERFRRFAALFADPAELAAALKAEGIPGEAALRERLAARIQQEKYVESRIAPKTAVTEEEARTWFEEHREQLAIPERADLQWVFAATATPDEPAPEALVNALAALTAGTADISAVTRDLAAAPDFRVSRAWTTRNRLPDDLAGPVFELPPGQPALLRSRAGWHLVAIAARQPARQREFAEAAAEITAALQAVKRRDFSAAFRAELRKHEDRAITIYREVLDP